MISASSSLVFLALLSYHTCTGKRSVVTAQGLLAADDGAAAEATQQRSSEKEDSFMSDQSTSSMADLGAKQQDSPEVSLPAGSSTHGTADKARHTAHGSDKVATRLLDSRHSTEILQQVREPVPTSAMMDLGAQRQGSPEPWLPAALPPKVTPEKASYTKVSQEVREPVQASSMKDLGAQQRDSSEASLSANISTNIALEKSRHIHDVSTSLASVLHQVKLAPPARPPETSEVSKSKIATGVFLVICAVLALGCICGRSNPDDEEDTCSHVDSDLDAAVAKSTSERLSTLFRKTSGRFAGRR